MQMFQLTTYKGGYRPVVLYFVHANSAKEERKKIGNGDIKIINIKGLKQCHAFDGMSWDDIARCIKK